MNPFLIGVLIAVFLMVFGGVSGANVGKPDRLKKASMAAATVTLIAGIGLTVLFSSSPGAKYKAEVTGFSVLPNNYVRVFLSVKNVGAAAGSPSCMVSIQPTNSYGDPIGSGGFDSMAGTHSVAVGDTYSGYMDIVVSDNAASDVTSKSMITVSNC